jgi:hypothetical protein
MHLTLPPPFGRPCWRLPARPPVKWALPLRVTVPPTGIGPEVVMVIPTSSTHQRCLATIHQRSTTAVDHALIQEPGEPGETNPAGSLPSKACGTQRPARLSGTPEGTGMWPIWNIIFASWRRVMRVGLIAGVVCVSACAASDRSGSTSVNTSPDAGQAGTVGSRNGGNGY